MKNKLMGFYAVKNRSIMVGAVVCGILFFCGVLLGSYGANRLGEDSLHGLSGYFSGYLELVRDGQAAAPTFWASLWSVFKLPLLALLFAFFVPGPLCILVLSGFRGFLLSFSVASIVRTFGMGGWKLAFAVFGLSAVITIPCFFILCVQSFSSSLELLRSVADNGRKGPVYTRVFFVRAGICGIALMVAAVFETWLVPAIVVLIA